MVLAVLAVGLIVALGVAGQSEDQPEAAVASSDDDNDEDESPDQPTTTAVGDLTADQAFTQASQRLQAAGSFAYTGTSEATDVSPVRPGLWLGVQLTTFGEVDLQAGRLHEIGLAADGSASETVTDGVTVWGRLASDTEGLAEQPYQTVGELGGEPPRSMGAALLSFWLDAAVDRQAIGPDFRAVIPAEAFGVIEDGRPAVAAEILLTLDPNGDPVHVEVTTAPAGPPLRLVLDLVRIGEPLAIALPVE